MLHSAVLEPDFDLSLREAQHGCHLYAAGAAQVAVEEELFLQLHQLGTGVGGPSSLGARRRWFGVLCRVFWNKNMFRLKSKKM